MMKDDSILLDHGAGGRASHGLLTGLFMPLFDNPYLSAQDDGAVFPVPAGRMAFSTDTFVVKPLFFPGGCIGDLAVNGTVNDLLMCGARPLHLSAGLVIEEGFPRERLVRILSAMRDAALRAGVLIVTGDTKVVPKGTADGLFINTAGIGIVPDGVCVSAGNVRPGDALLLSGGIGEHGVAVLCEREGLRFDTPVVSDTAALVGLAEALLAAAPGAVRAMRDPTRGGLAAGVNEIAEKAGIEVRLFEERIPVAPAVAAACEILGLDPLHVACEGRMMAFVARDAAESALAALRSHPLGAGAALIGEAAAGRPGRVVLETAVGGERIVDMPQGELLPRIC